MNTIVKVYNKNIYEYREVFRDKEYVVPANGFIELDYEEAIKFLGQMSKFKRAKDGTQDPRTFKWLVMDEADKKRVELFLRNEQEEKAKKVFVCHACGKEFMSKKKLLNHAEEEHADIMVKEDEEENE